MRRRNGLVWAAFACAAWTAGACGDDPKSGAAASTSASGSAAPGGSAAGADDGGAKEAAAVVKNRSGSAIAMTMRGDALLVASEDHKALFRVALPLSAGSNVERIEMPGAPAQIVILADRVLVTVRDPGLLLELAEAEGGALVEKRRVELAADAWGMAVTPDGATAVVTSAWTRTVSGVDLGAMSVTWSKEVAREPRGVLVLPNGKRAYVSHLMGTALTRIDDIASADPGVKKVELAAAPSRAANGKLLGADLGYSLVADPDGRRVFVPRHALGALANWLFQTSWWGATTVDVLRTQDDKGIAPAKNGDAAVVRTEGEPKDVGDMTGVAYTGDPALDGPHAPLPMRRWNFGLQPRAAVYRKRTDTVLVAGEGDGTIVELDARALEPALHPLRIYQVKTEQKKPFVMPKTGGAPSGIVMDDAEAKAYVFGRSTYDVSAVELDDEPREAPSLSDRGSGAALGDVVTLAEDPLLESVSSTDPKRKAREAAMWGRRFYYAATDSEMSEDMACASCHPEGRDDGFTWSLYPSSGVGELYASQEQRDVVSDDEDPPGMPRQTPMLAGRVMAAGPYGWTGESETLDGRVEVGFALHHASGKNAKGQAITVAAFLRLGLRPPPKVTRALTAVEEQGRAVFTSNEAGCTACHDPASAYTDRKPVLVKVPERASLPAEEGVKFKTPSLLWVVGSPPYFHNGSVGSLDELVLGNDDRMGKTNQLSAADKAALIAYLRTL